MFFRLFYPPAGRVEETKTKSFEACYSIHARRLYLLHPFVFAWRTVLRNDDP